ncbi:MAG TPA: hypothetical protein VEG30_17060 [Terriglobales bacterium]|nr:hypothetical protein [Terriglobales bacterium]
MIGATGCAVGQRSFLLLLTFAFVSAAMAFGQLQGDAHVTLDRASAFLQKSAFAHGYMHGYEEGFHVADSDLQMYRDFREVKSMEKFRKCIGYRPEYGERHMFDSGYHEGFRVGYFDGYAGRRFRAVEGVRRAAGDLLDHQQMNFHPSHSFDEAVMAGYLTGRTQGLQDGREASSYRSVAGNCSSILDARHAGAGPEYCEAFRRGYQIGYGDGYTNQRPPSSERDSPPAKEAEVAASEQSGGR